MRKLIRLLLALLLLAVFGLGLAYWYAPERLLQGSYDFAAWRAGLTKRSVDAGGHRWSYYEGGSGEPVLLLHGLGGSKENWLLLARYLTGEHRILIPDLPGWGESSRMPDEDYGLRAQARRVRAFVGALGLPNAHVVGHSMGGAIAGTYAAHYTSRVATLTLVEPAGVPFPANEFAREVLAGRNLFDYGTREQLQAFGTYLFQQPPWIPPRLLDVLVDQNLARRAFQGELFEQLSQGEDAEGLASRLPMIRVPVLVIWCNGDRVIDKAAMDTVLAGLPQARGVTLYGCSHMPMLESPRELAQPISEFVRAPTPTRPEPVPPDATP
jgi:pimeloyl-ACP methyl ester carboxylesterase